MSALSIRPRRDRANDPPPGLRPIQQAINLIRESLGMLADTATTAIIQSSSVTTFLVVGFESAGLMSLSQSIGVIIGANIGTTISAQMVAFKISDYAMLFIGIGFFVE